MKPYAPSAAATTPLFTCTKPDPSAMMQSDPPLGGNTGHSVFLGNLDPRMTEANCRKLLGRYGRAVTLTHVTYNPASVDAKDHVKPTSSTDGGATKEKDGTSNDEEVCGCFVLFSTRDEAKAAVKALDNKNVLGRKATARRLVMLSAQMIDALQSGQGMDLVVKATVTAEEAMREQETAREAEIRSAQERLQMMEQNLRRTNVMEDAPQNGKMFKGDGGPLRGGVWNGVGMTHTKQCPTLIVANVPRSVNERAVSDLFKKQPGFFALRCVRGMYFVDFDGVASATNAMIKCQNHAFAGHERDGGHGSGIAIDYDKDSRDKRNKQYERNRKERMYKR